MTSVSRLLSMVATPLLFGYVAYSPPIPSAGTYPERVVPGLLFGVILLGIGLVVEPDDR